MSRPWPTVKQIGLMWFLLAVVVSLVAYSSIRNFKSLEINGVVTEIVLVSGFHAQPRLTIQNTEGKIWVLHNTVFKELGVTVGQSFVKHSGSTMAYINGHEVSLGWVRN